MLEIIPAVSFFGIFIGILISKHTREEVRGNRNYFMILSKIILGILIFILLLFIKDFLLFFIGVFAGFLSAYLLSEFLFLGLGLGTGLFLQKDYSLVISSLIFMYSLLYGSLLRISKVNFTKMLILFIMFFLPFSLFLLEKVLYIDMIIGFTAGGLSNYIVGNKFILI
ncbi:hypothetical protein HYX16_05100 [Candidatus Woesearchaeota archaeon]|nr:hypothetical protein [Candidatus Woesearchaeota archaeon]